MASDIPNNFISVPDPDCLIIYNLDQLNNFLIPSHNNNKHNILHVNIRSLRANFDNLLALISECLNYISIIVLSEIWIYDNETSFYNFDGFDSFFCCRSDNRSGGIAVFTKCCLNVSNLDISFSSAEVVLLYSKTLNITLLSLYRNHDYSIDCFNREIKNVLNLLKHPNILLIGDLNINILESDNNTIEYLNILSQFGFQNFINKPTRSCLSSSTCIDHIFVKTKSLKVKSGIFITDLSDHYPILCQLEKSEITCPTNEPISYLSLNHSEFYGYLSTYIIRYNADSTLDQRYQKLIFDISNIKNNFKYPRKFKRKSKNDWVTAEIISLIKRKEKLFKKFKKYPLDLVFKTAYKSTVSELKRIINLTKKQYYQNKFESLDSDKLKWNFANKVTNKSAKTCVLPDSSNDFELASQFNEMFKNVNHNNPYNDMMTYQRYITPCITSFVFLDINNFEVLDVLNSFSKLDSFDFDGVCIRYLKIIAQNNIDFITNFINLSFSTCSFPRSLKQATITPIYKSGGKNVLTNYRPISILPSFSKIIEKIFANKMLDFLNHTNFFANNQFGFLPGRSTEMVLLKFSKFIYKNIDHNNFTVSIFLDIKKAFDNVNHSILIYKLINAGFRGDILKWLTSYLSERQQRVKIGNTLSEYTPINRGVPQGSILGPLFFLIFINDLCKLKLFGKMLTYADDTVLLYANSNLNDLTNQIESDLIEIETWFNANDLTLNLNKTKYIHFSLRKSNINLNLKYHSLTCNKTNHNCQCHILQSVESIKYLGLNIDCNLKWKTHVNDLGKKLRFILVKMYHLKNIVHLNFLKKLYYAWFYSLINYGVIIWGGEYRSNLQPLISIQNKCFKLLVNFQSLNTPNFRIIQLLPIRYNAFFRIILYLYRNKHICNFKLNVRNTRSNEIFQIPSFSKDIFRRHFFYLAPHLFNKLPKNLTDINSFYVFKKDLFNFLINIDDLDLCFSL